MRSMGNFTDIIIIELLFSGIHCATNNDFQYANSVVTSMDYYYLRSQILKISYAF